MQVEIIGNDGNRKLAEIDIRHLSSSEKSIDSLKKFAIFFALALCAVPIPFAHFVLVPGLLIGGVFFAVKNFLSRGSVIENSKVDCPNCEKKQNLDGKTALFPLKDTCVGCRRQYKVDLV